MDIVGLVQNVDRLAGLWKTIALSEFEFFKLIFTCEYSKYVTGELVYVNRKQFVSDEQAFVALFKQNVFESELWNDNNANLTVNEWKNSLENFIISDYMNLKNFRNMSVDEFWDRFIIDMKAFGKNKEFVDYFKGLNKELKVYALYEYSPSVTVFGISEEIYFIYDFFAGD